MMGSVMAGSILKATSKASLISARETLKPSRWMKPWLARVLRYGHGLRSEWEEGLAQQGPDVSP